VSVAPLRPRRRVMPSRTYWPSVRTAALRLRRFFEKLFPWALSRRGAAPKGQCLLLARVPAELLAAVAAFLSAPALAAQMAACSALRDVGREYDNALWEPLCDRAWKHKAFDPLSLYADTAALRGWRDRYATFEADGRRAVASAADLQFVKRWRVHLLAPRPHEARCYEIGPFPYRANFEYVSPTLRPGSIFPYYVLEPELFAPKAAPGRASSTYVQVSGMSRVRVVRRSDWGWDLRSEMYHLQSIEHARPPHELGGPSPPSVLSQQLAKPPGTRWRNAQCPSSAIYQ